jgi:hypothetical protein
MVAKRMQEVLPAVYHWTAVHPRIGTRVSSYWLDGAGVAFDPLVPRDAGLEWFAQRKRQPVAVVLSNRHHMRDAARFAERFGCPVYCNSAGLHEFAGGKQSVEGFELGAQLEGEVRACEMDAICADDTALHFPSQRALLLADGVVRGGPYGGDGPLGWVPDSLMDEPERTKAGLLASCARLLEELDFEHLLLAHGGPIVGNGRELLQELVDSGGRTAFEM